MATPGITITNLTEFRRDLRAAADATPRELTAALKKAGTPILRTTERFASAASRTGAMARSYSVRASGTSAKIVSRVPYGAGGEWGMGGKWRGFQKYAGAPDSGGRGRFAWRAVLAEQDQVVEIIYDELGEIVRLHGWAQEV